MSIRTVSLISLTAGIAAALISATDAAAQNCRDRDGRCMTVRVNGQATVKLSKQRKKELERVKPTHSIETRYEISQTKYELATPVRGELDVRADGVRGSQRWFGDLGSVDVIVVPLQRVELNTRQTLAADSSVRVGGAPVVTRQNVVEGNKLPPGKYLLVVTLSGASNWDRMVLYLEVAQDQQ